MEKIAIHHEEHGSWTFTTSDQSAIAALLITSNQFLTSKVSFKTTLKQTAQKILIELHGGILCQQKGDSLEECANEEIESIQEISDADSDQWTTPKANLKSPIEKRDQPLRSSPLKQETRGRPRKSANKTLSTSTISIKKIVIADRRSNDDGLNNSSGLDGEWTSPRSPKKALKRKNSRGRPKKSLDPPKNNSHANETPKRGRGRPLLNSSPKHNKSQPLITVYASRSRQNSKESPRSSKSEIDLNTSAASSTVKSTITSSPLKSTKTGKRGRPCILTKKTAEKKDTSSRRSRGRPKKMTAIKVVTDNAEESLLE
jgi:hypothetical protein